MRKRATGAQLDAAFRNPPMAGTGAGTPIVNGSRSGQGLPLYAGSGFQAGVAGARSNAVASKLDTRNRSSGVGTPKMARSEPANASQELVTNGVNNPGAAGAAPKGFA